MNWSDLFNFGSQPTNGGFNATTDPSQVAPWSPGAMLDPTATAPGQMDWMTRLMGGKAPDGSQSMGIASPLLGLGKGIVDGWMGMQKLGVAKDSLAFQEDAFSKQFNIQQALTNEQLRSQHDSRMSANPAAWGNKQVVQV